MTKHPDKWASLPPPMLPPHRPDEFTPNDFDDDLWNGYRPPRKWYDGGLIVGLVAVSAAAVVGLVVVIVLAVTAIVAWPW